VLPVPQQPQIGKAYASYLMSLLMLLLTLYDGALEGELESCPVLSANVSESH
jgi:hypothetical protein